MLHLRGTDHKKLEWDGAELARRRVRRQGSEARGREEKPLIETMTGGPNERMPRIRTVTKTLVETTDTRVCGRKRGSAVSSYSLRRSGWIG